MRRGRHAGELGGEGERDGGRDRPGRGRVPFAPGGRRGSAAPRELLEVERIAAAHGIEAGHVAAHQHRGLVLGERQEREAGDAVLAHRGGEGRRERAGERALAHREREQDRAGGRPACERRERVEGAGIGPLDVVEAEHQRASGRGALEQVAQGAVEAVAIGRRRVAERGQHGGERRRVREPQPPDGAFPQCLQQRAERVGEHRVGQVGLELGRPAGGDAAARRLRARRQLGEQARLADPGLALDDDHATGPCPQARQRRVERVALGRAADERGQCAGLHHLATSLADPRGPDR